MAKQPKTEEVAAIIRAKRLSSGDFGDAVIFFMRRQPNGELWSYHYGEFANLQISCQWNLTAGHSSPIGQPYGFKVEYSDETDLQNIDVRAKCLKGVRAGLERAERRDGNVETFGEYCLRVFRVLGVDVLLEPRPGGTADESQQWEIKEVKPVFARLLAGTLNK